MHTSPDNHDISHHYLVDVVFNMSGPSYDNVQMLEDDEGLELNYSYWN